MSRSAIPVWLWLTFAGMFVFGTVGSILLGLRSDSKAQQGRAVILACLGPAKDRPPKPKDGPDPCEAIRKIEARLTALEAAQRKLGMNCEDLSTSCVRLTGLIDNSLHNFIRSHVEPATIMRARDGFERYRQAEGIGGE